MIQIGSDICGDPAQALSLEWLETNGIGGYASSTVSGANARRYHALLVAAARPPVGRVVLVSKFEETLITPLGRYDLSTSRYPDVIDPDGFRYLVEFRLDPFPVWTYSVGGIVVERSLFMVHGENTTVIHWRVLDRDDRDAAVTFDVRPLITSRDHHHLGVDRSMFDEKYEIGTDVVSISPLAGHPPIWIAHSEASVSEERHWYRNFEYTIEEERGFDHREDLYQPFRLSFDLSDEVVVILSDHQKNAADAEKLKAAEIKRRAELVARSGMAKQYWPLVLASDQFVVDRGGGKTVIAGYPWFSDWGRDTMIALPGLTLACGRPEIARDILEEFGRHISEGMIPNRFPDEGETPDYNTVDATLWYFEAIRAYTEKTSDLSLVRDLYDRLVNIIDWHLLGTRYNIRVDDDGLLNCGHPHTQLTWMDAKVGDQVFTPRTGKPVEIQALWYNALVSMADFARALGDERGPEWTAMAERAKASFLPAFWNESAECLCDVVNGGEQDTSIRPNQIFAVSLRHSMLDDNEAKKIVRAVESALLTPFGLRSLERSDPRYVGVYIGSPYERDSGYHQGTVWAWLLGPFIDAYRRVHSSDPNLEERVAEMIGPLLEHLHGACIGQVSEIFDGEKPHHPRGCPAQAWSVAELLRVIAQAPSGNPAD